MLKSPQHLEQFGTLYATFPDATFVVTHRDPVDVTRSMATMVAYASRMGAAHPDPVRTGRYWLDRAADLFTGCVRDRDVLPAASRSTCGSPISWPTRRARWQRFTSWPASPTTTPSGRPCGGSSPITPAVGTAR